jgi:hypothetical protein
MRTRNTVILLALLVGLVGLYPSGAQSDDPPTWQFTVKFLCGQVDSDSAGASGDLGRDEDADPVVPGVYETAINLHNPNISTVQGSTSGPSVSPAPSDSSSGAFAAFNFSPTFRKKAVLLFPQETGREELERPQIPEAWYRPDPLRYDFGFEIDCEDIRNKLLADNDGSGSSSDPDPRADDEFLKGYVVIEERSSLPLDVTVAYTSYGLAESTTTGSANPEQGTICERPTTGSPPPCELVAGFSEDVEHNVIPKRIR